MADKSISELNPATSVGATDLFVLQQAGAAKKLTGQILENWLVSFAEGHGGIQTVEKTSTVGRVDTYTITYADESTSTFTVTNGEKGDTGAQTYVHIKYSAVQPTRDADIGNIPDDYMGIYIGLSSTAPTTYTSYVWNKVKGETGATGAAASITAQSVQYQASASGTVVPTGVWSNSVPAVAEGQYLWTRTIVTYNSGTTTTAYSVGYKGVNGTGAGDMTKQVYDAQGSVESAGGIADYVGSQLPSAAQQNPQMDGQANVGASSDYARADHVHPSDTAKANSNLSNVSNGAVKTAMLDAGAVTSAKIAANAVSTLYTATLLANGWENEGGSVPTYKQVVNVAGILSTDIPTIDLDFSIGTWTRATQVSVNEEWRVVRAWTGNGTLTVRMSEPPTQDIPIQILCIRK